MLLRTNYKWEVTTAASLGLINLLEQLTKLKRTVSLLYSLLINRCNSGTAHMEETQTSRYEGKGQGFRVVCRSVTLSAFPGVHPPRCSTNTVLLGF